MKLPPTTQEDKLSIEKYLEIEHPTIWKEYCRYRDLQWDSLQVGQQIQVLKSGFHGYGGNLRTIAEKSTGSFGDYLLLKHKDCDCRCVVLRKPDPDRVRVGYEWEWRPEWRPQYWWQIIRVPTPEEAEE